MMVRIIGLVLLMMSVTAMAEHDIYSFETPLQRQQFTLLLKQFRCLVCQNQDLNESNAPLAIDLKDVIYHQLKQGQSNDEIIHYLRGRYGDFVLFQPPLNKQTYVLWFGPLLLLIIAFAILLRIIWRRQQLMDDLE